MPRHGITTSHKAYNTTLAFMLRVKRHRNQESAHPLDTSSTFPPQTELSLHGRAEHSPTVSSAVCVAWQPGQKFMVMFWVIGQGQEGGGRAIGGGCVVTVWRFRLCSAGLGSATEVRRVRGWHQTWGSSRFRVLRREGGGG